MTPILLGALCYLALDGVGYLFGKPVAMGVAIGIAFTSVIYLIADRNPPTPLIKPIGKERADV